MPVLIPIILLAAGVGVVVALALASVDRPVPVHEPDLPANAPAPAGFPKSTGYKLVDKILPLLKQAADSSGVPLGLLVGWICEEDGGKFGGQREPVGDVTSRNERGYFQIDPSESAKLKDPETGKIGLDHERLSTDQMYSINCGLALIGKYMGLTDALGIAPRGSSFYWRCVKWFHTMGSGAVQKITAMAKAAGAARSWNALEDYALSHESEIMHAVKHSPTKWFPFVDRVYKRGVAFGFGSSDTIVGGEVFSDIVDPLDALGRG